MSEMELRMESFCLRSPRATHRASPMSFIPRRTRRMGKKTAAFLASLHGLSRGGGGLGKKNAKRVFPSVKVAFTYSFTTPPGGA